MRRVFEIEELCDIDVIAGADDVLFEMLVDGAVGWFAGYPNAFPKEAVELYDLCVSGKWHGGARALRAPGRGVPLGLAHRVRPGDQAVDGHLRHSYGGPTRPPRGPLTAEQHAQVTADTERAFGRAWRRR